MSFRPSIRLSVCKHVHSRQLSNYSELYLEGCFSMTHSFDLIRQCCLLTWLRVPIVLSLYSLRFDSHYFAFLISCLPRPSVTSAKTHDAYHPLLHSAIYLRAHYANLWWCSDMGCSSYFILDHFARKINPFKICPIVKETAMLIIQKPKPLLNCFSTRAIFRSGNQWHSYEWVLAISKRN